MAKDTPLVRFLNSLIELGWLFILIGVPVFFNVRDYRVFEPDKIVLLRNTVLVMTLLFLLKMLYLLPYYLVRRSDSPAERQANSKVARLIAAARRFPIVAAALVFAAIYVVATLTSIAPRISFWGSFDRLEGTYTYLTYITLFLLIATHLRTWSQVERLVTAVILASVPVAAYSWLQHFKADPLVWADQNATALRTPSTVGNPIFLAAFLLMAVPFTIYRLVLRVKDILEVEPRDTGSIAAIWQALGAAGYGAAIGLQIGAIGFSGSRGPALGFLAALIVFGLGLAIGQRIRWLLQLTAALAILLLLVLGVTNTVLRSSDTPGGGFSRFLHLLPSESGSSEVRSLLWKSAPGLWEQHPILGCGPEVLIFCWYPHYPADLRKVELANAAPDRSHDEEIDVLLTTGIVGEVSYLFLLGTIGTLLVRLLRRARDLRGLLFVCALLAAFIGHIVEGVTGIAFSATLVLLWTVAGIATALDIGILRGAAGFFAFPAADALGGERPPIATEPPSPPTGRAASSRGTRRSRQDQSRSTRKPERVPVYSFSTAFSRQGGAAVLLFGAAAAAVGAAVILGIALFISNIQLIEADVDYRTGQNYEQAAGSYLQQALGEMGASPSSSTYQQGLQDYQRSLQAYQTAVQAYEDALNQGPSWNAPPPQDTYRLFLGKTLLEYAEALAADKTAKTNHAQIDGVIGQALTSFTQAAADNPLNPDHPRNLAKLYSFWGSAVYGTVDVAKLVRADQYFTRAHALAPHNADILDEWAVLDTQLGNNDSANAHRWFAEALQHLQLAQPLYPEDGAVYRDMGTIYNQYATWAEQAKDTVAAQRYYRLEERNWLMALGYDAPEYQKIYPRLTQLYYLKLKEPCPAGQYAYYGLQAIRNNALADPNGQLSAALQSVLSTAQARKCSIKTT